VGLLPGTVANGMDEGKAGRLGTDASRLVVAPLPVELTATRAARFAWQRRFRAAGNRVSLGAIVAQSTIARNFFRGEPWPDELKTPGWWRGGSSWLLMRY
jgi:hypothetical protein